MILVLDHKNVTWSVPDLLLLDPTINAEALPKYAADAIFAFVDHVSRVFRDMANETTFPTSDECLGVMFCIEIIQDLPLFGLFGLGNGVMEIAVGEFETGTISDVKVGDDHEVKLG